MVYPFFIAYMVVGLAVTLCIFVWAVRSGQFKDQQRARYLPLEEDMEKGRVDTRALSRYQAGAILFLKVIGLLFCTALLLYTFIF